MPGRGMEKFPIKSIFLGKRTFWRLLIIDHAINPDSHGWTAKKVAQDYQLNQSLNAEMQKQNER